MDLQVRELGLVDYAETCSRMQAYTDGRDAGSTDQIWLLQHPPVYTQGQAGKAEHILSPGDIPVIQADRGGQVTYHGPGQLVAYILVDLVRAGLGVRRLVQSLEQAVIDTLAGYAIEAHPRRDAPGVYTASGAKIASLGLRVRRGRSYHGLALNVAMDLEPFSRINPCGMQGQTVTQVCDQGGPSDINTVTADLLPNLRRCLGYPCISESASDPIHCQEDTVRHP
jgi:lipoyl(octanoyl) transferase